MLMELSSGQVERDRITHLRGHFLMACWPGYLSHPGKRGHLHREGPGEGSERLSRSLYSYLGASVQCTETVCPQAPRTWSLLEEEDGHKQAMSLQMHGGPGGVAGSRVQAGGLSRTLPEEVLLKVPPD